VLQGPQRVLPGDMPAALPNVPGPPLFAPYY
jgi:hypothetical protein